MRKLKQRPTYLINSKKGDKYHQTHVKSEKEDLKSKESDKNKSLPKRKVSRLFEEIQANSYKLSEEVRDNNNQNDMIKEDTDRHRKGRKHLNNTYNGYLNICIYILMYISVIVKYLVTGACQSERWRLTATPVLTEMYTLVEIATKVDKIHKKHNKKYRKDVFNANPDVEFRNNGIYDNFIDVMKRWRLTTTPVLTEIYTSVKSHSKSSKTHEKHCDNLQDNVLCMYSCLKICNSAENTYFGSWLTNWGRWEPLVTPPPTPPVGL